MEKTLLVEDDIHTLAPLIDGFFKELYQQPSRTWVKSITDTVLLPFLKRRELQKAALFGERDASARFLCSPENPQRQDWMAWFLPLLTQQEALTEVSEDKAIESVTSMGVVMVTACLYWAFMTESPEDFGSFLGDMQTKIEQLGWNEMNRARVHAIYKGLISKITHRWTTENTNHFWRSLNVLSAHVEEFVFYTPFYGFHVKPEAGLLGLHTDKAGLCEKDLLQQLTHLVTLQSASAKQATVVRMTDKKETAEFNRHRDALEDTRVFLVTALTWALAFAAELEAPMDEALRKTWSSANDKAQAEVVFASDKSTQQLVEGLSRRARFKGSSKAQALECCRAALAGCLRARASEENKAAPEQGEEQQQQQQQQPCECREALVPLEAALEQAKAAASSLHRLVGFVNKVVETKVAYAQVIERTTSLDETSKAIADEMSGCVEISSFVKYIENSQRIRLRNFIAVTTTDVLQPLQALESEYESFVATLRIHQTKITRDIEYAKAGLLKLLDEAEKDMQEVVQVMKQEAQGKSMRKANTTQKCATSFGRYEQGSLEYSTKTFADARALQKKVLKEFEQQEQRRLQATQVYVRRYLQAFASLQEPFPHLAAFEKELKLFSAAGDVSKFVAKAQKFEPTSPQVPALPCSAVDIVTGAFVDMMLKKEVYEGVDRSWFGAVESPHRRQASRDLLLRPSMSPPAPIRSVTRLALPTSASKKEITSNASPRPKNTFVKLYQKLTTLFPDSSQGVEVNDAPSAGEITHYSFPLSVIREKWLFQAEDYLMVGQRDPGPSAALHGALSCLRVLYQLGSWAAQIRVEVGLLAKTSDCGNTSVSMGLASVYFQEKKDNQAIAFLVCGNGGARLQLYVKAKGIVSCVMEYRPASAKTILNNLRNCAPDLEEVSVDQTVHELQSLLSSAPWITNEKFRSKLAKQFKVQDRKLTIPVFGYVCGALRDHWETLESKEERGSLETTVNTILGTCLGPDTQFSAVLQGEPASYFLRQLLEGQMELLACRALYRQFSAVTGQVHLEPVVALGVGKSASQWTFANAANVDDYTMYRSEPSLKFGMDNESFPERLCSAILSQYSKNTEGLATLMQRVADRRSVATIALKSGCLLKLSQSLSGRQRRKALVEPSLFPPLASPISVVFTRRSGGPRVRCTLTSGSPAVACADACRLLAGSEDPQFLRVELEHQPGLHLQDLANLAPGTALAFLTVEEIRNKSSRENSMKETSIGSERRVSAPPPPPRESESRPSS